MPFNSLEGSDCPQCGPVDGGPLRVALKGSYSVVRPVKVSRPHGVVGTVPMKAFGWRPFMLSHAKNQNSLFRVSRTLGIKKGPPAVTPYGSNA